MSISEFIYLFFFVTSVMGFEIFYLGTETEKVGM